MAGREKGKRNFPPFFLSLSLFFTIQRTRLSRSLGALSIQPKIPLISVGTSNGTDHFGLVRAEYSGPALKVAPTVTGLVILVGRTEMSVSICQNSCPQYRSFLSCLQDQVVSNGK